MLGLVIYKLVKEKVYRKTLKWDNKKHKKDF